MLEGLAEKRGQTPDEGGQLEVVRDHVYSGQLPAREKSCVPTGANDSYVEGEEPFITSPHCHP